MLFPMKLSSYLKIFPCPDQPGSYLVYSTRRCSVVRLSALILRGMEEGTLPQGDRDTLARLGMLVDDPVAERESVINRFTEATAGASMPLSS